MSHAASDSRPSPLFFSSYLLILGGVDPFREAFPPSPKEAQRRSADVEDSHETSLQTRRDGGRGASPIPVPPDWLVWGGTPPGAPGGLALKQRRLTRFYVTYGVPYKKFLAPTSFASG